jgi:hypothetical protein
MRTVVVAASVACTVSVGCAATSPARSISTDTGYSVAMVSAVPTPGSSLPEGRPVTFTVTVDYSLAVTDSGRVVLLLQDDHGTNLIPGRPQASEMVQKGSGRVTLSDTLTVPKGIRQVQLFVLLAPWAYGRISQRVFVGYPVNHP